MAITITSLSEPATTSVYVYFTADSHWSTWNRADTIVNGENYADDAWTAGWFPEEPGQRVRLTNLTPATEYTVKIEKRSGAPGAYTYEYSNLESFTTAGVAPGAPTLVSPTPTGVTDITLDETPLEWAAGDPAGDTYEVYFSIQGDDWETVPVGEAQAGLTWAIAFGLLGYGIEYSWRIDATNEYGTTEGTVWTFTAMAFAPPLPTGVTLDAEGEPTGTPTGESGMVTVRRLVVAANDKIWYEDI